MSTRLSFRSRLLALLLCIFVGGASFAPENTAQRRRGTAPRAMVRTGSGPLSVMSREPIRAGSQGSVPTKGAALISAGCTLAAALRAAGLAEQNARRAAAGVVSADDFGRAPPLSV